MRAVRAVFAAAVALAGSGAVLAPSSAATDVPCSPTGLTRSVAPYWQALTPKFTAGSPAVTDVAAPAYAPDLLYATNGVQVVRSLDAGCSWKVVLDLRTTGRTTQQGTVRVLNAPSSANSSSYLYVGVSADIAALSEPAVFVSEDRGDSWQQQSSGLPPLGAVRSLAASPRLPQTAYALVAQDVAGQTVTGGIWATSDAGATWAQRTPAQEAFAATSILAGTRQETELLALVGGNVRRSGDGGRTFHDAGPTSGDVVAFDLAGGGGGYRIVAGHGGSNRFSRSDDTGSSWSSVASPVPAQRVAMAPLQDLVAVGSNAETWLVGTGGFRRQVTPEANPPDRLQLSAPTASGFALTGVAGGSVLRVTFSLAFDPIRPTRRPLRLLPYAPHHQFPSTLTPVHSRVVLPAGGSTRVPYTLLLPRTPSPLDVMFLIDSTGSMGGVIEGLRQGITSIVSTLNRSGLDVRVGLGDFKDYAQPAGAGGPGDYPYRLDRRIGPADESLRTAIAGLEAYGGGGPASALTALVQAATGKGEVLDDVVFVKPGGQAGYRPRTLRLDVLATDVKMRRRAKEGQIGKEADRLGPTMAEAIATLRKTDVHVVGLAVAPEVEPDMRLLAEGTRTFAPDGGVDCNGDGAPDVGDGSPLVCSLYGPTDASSPANVSVNGSTVGGGGGTVSLAGAVIGLAEALPDNQRVSVRVTQGRAYAELLGRSTRSQVNLKADNELAHTLRLSCPRFGGTGSHRIALAATAGIRQVAQATVELVCQPRLGAAVLDPGDAPQADPKAAPAPPAQPPQAPNPNPNPNPNTNPNMNPNLNMNAGAAAQEQQIQQLALVGESYGQAAETSEELAMSRPAPSPPVGVFVGAAGLLFVAASCLAVRARGVPATAEERS